MLVAVDASQIEWRVALQMSQDPVGIAEILSGADIHSNNEKAFELPSRLIAKVFLFRTVFRGSGWSFANDPDFMHVSTNPTFWDGMNEKFYIKYAGLNRLHHKWKDIVVAGKPIEGPFGRSWSIGMKRDYKGELKIPWTVLSNFPIQGTAADVMMFVRISAYKRIKKAGIPCDWISTVHDSLVVDCEEKYIQAIVDIFHQVFDDLPKNFKAAYGYSWTVPMTCEVKIGMNMKDMKKVKRSLTS
jgi:DNA polymerase I-like protein with 3'-5' exonuclease and polymerase domains